MLTFTVFFVHAGIVKLLHLNSVFYYFWNFVPGIAYVGFKTEQDLDQALRRNKNFIGGKRIFLKKAEAEDIETEKPEKPRPWELKVGYFLVWQATNMLVEQCGSFFSLYIWICTQSCSYAFFYNFQTKISQNEGCNWSPKSPMAGSQTHLNQ